MDRIQIFSIIASAVLFVVVFELTRRRRLMERYALLWFFSAIVLLCLSVWRDGLEEIADAVGIFYAPSALFAIAFGLVTVVLLHFSIVISRLADQSKLLAQQVGILKARVAELEADRPSAVGDRPSASAEARPPEPSELRDH